MAEDEALGVGEAHRDNPRMVVVEVGHVGKVTLHRTEV